MKTSAFLLLAALTGILHAQGPLTPPGAPAPTMKTLDQLEPRTPVSSLPFTISAPGSYYLTGDLTGTSGQSGIIIDAPDVTLDLKGFTLRGVAGSLKGIAVKAAGLNHFILNGNIRGWGGNGLEAVPTSGNLEGLHCLNNGGSGFNVAENCRIRNCHASSNGVDGIHAGAGSSLHDCVVELNTGSGIRVVSPGMSQALTGPSDLREIRSVGNGQHGMFIESAVSVRDSSASSNGGDGIRATGGSSLLRCVVEQNTGSGVQVVSPGMSQAIVGPQDLHDVRSSKNGQNGFTLEIACIVRDCVGTSNLADGIHSVDGSSIRECLVDGNTGSGVRVVSPGMSQGLVGPSDLRNIRSVGNGQNGFTLSPHSAMRDCVAVSNTGDGINASEHSTFRDCVVESNTGNGVQVVSPGMVQGIGDTIEIRGIRSVGNSATGILIGLNQGTIRDCVVAGNKSDGIRAPSLFTISDNELRGNGVGANGGKGLALTGTNNVVLGNHSLQNNGANFDIPAVNDAGPLGTASQSTSPFGNIQP